MWVWSRGSGRRIAGYRREQVLGEAGKFLITVLLFAMVFLRFKGVQVPWLFTGFILELLVAWIVPLVVTLRSKR